LYVEDDTGKILVKLDKLNNFYNNKGKSVLNEVTLTKVTSDISEPINGTVCIIGEASDTTGELIIKEPKDTNEPFFVAFISLKKFTEYMENHFGLFLGGLFFTLMGFLFLLVGG
jgi:glycine cleavage system H lipoate-binding protein